MRGKKKRKMNRKKLIAIAIFSLSLILSIGFWVFRDYFKGATSLGLLGLFILNLVSNASFFISGPAFLSAFVGGSIYPPILVALAAAGGSAVGDMLSYVVGLSGRKALEHKLNKKIWFRVLEKVFKQHGTWILLIFALIPNFVFDSIGLFAGALAFPPLRFFILVFVGRLVRFFILASIGAHF